MQSSWITENVSRSLAIGLDLFDLCKIQECWLEACCIELSWHVFWLWNSRYSLHRQDKWRVQKATSALRFRTQPGKIQFKPLIHLKEMPSEWKPIPFRPSPLLFTLTSCCWFKMPVDGNAHLQKIKLLLAGLFGFNIHRLPRSPSEKLGDQSRSLLPVNQ